MNVQSSDGSVRCVFFDVGGTMLRVQPSVGAVYSRTAAEHGFDVSPRWLDNRFRSAWEGSLRRSRERSHTCSDAILRNEWFTIVRETFGESVPKASVRPLFEDLYERFVSPSAWTLAGGARETFEGLRSLGVRLGILSNWDSRLPRMIAQFGLAELFEVSVISYEVGYEKPHASIFETATARAAEEPRRILYVGDCWETDIAPARQLGLKTLWMAPSVERERRRDAGPGAEGFGELSLSDWDDLLAGRVREES